MEGTIELSSETNSVSLDAAYRRKRKRNSGTESTGYQEESFAQVSVFDSGNVTPPKKVKPTATEQHVEGVDETKAVKDVTLHNLRSDQSINNNKLNSPVSFVPSPGSDSNSTIPLETEQTENVSEVIELAAIENQALVLTFNNSEMAKVPPVVSEPPGNFAFINLGFPPSSLCSGLANRNVVVSPTFSARENVVEETSVHHLENSESCGASEEKKDLINYSPHSPILSPCTDNREACIVPSSPSEPAGDELAALSGIDPVTVSANQDYAILPEDASIECRPRLQQNPRHTFDCDNSPYFSFALRGREEYIPLNVGTDELEKKEIELREVACKIKEFLTTIVAASKRLEGERELLKSKLTELHADMTVRAAVMNSLNQASTTNREERERCLAERNRQHALIVEIKIRLVKKELAMRELQVAICQEKLLAVSSDTPVDSLGSAIAANEEKVTAISTDIRQCYEEEKVAKEMLVLLEEKLKKYTEEDNLQRRHIDEFNLQQRKAESLVSKNEDSLKGATLELKELIKQRKNYSTYFVNLERMMVKIKVCRKLKELDRKEERIIGKKIHEPSKEQFKATSNVQYASQLTVFGRNYQPLTLEQPTISCSSSAVQHFTSLQSIEIHNHTPWLPQPFLPLSRFSPGPLQMAPLALPWIDSQTHQNP
ncbi:uncharacterized protein LOC130690816 isoform X2 [Daphnia carinata]|uniref:uncharacterized protein LOC130690816 isoform X2 n=1 Tax=Daphnia carinata TaxID=120202 RepID=UPI00257ADB86|nr:uncharacterized protein LOC130690816 isoform X2 [Daphnia carinata]